MSLPDPARSVPNPSARWEYPSDRYNFNRWLRAPRVGYSATVVPGRTANELLLLEVCGCDGRRRSIKLDMRFAGILSTNGWRYTVAQALKQIRAALRADWKGEAVDLYGQVHLFVAGDQLQVDPKAWDVHGVMEGDITGLTTAIELRPVVAIRRMGPRRRRCYLGPRS